MLGPTRFGPFPHPTARRIKVGVTPPRNSTENGVPKVAGRRNQTVRRRAEFQDWNRPRSGVSSAHSRVTTVPPTAQPPAPPSRASLLLAGALLVVAVLAAYANSLHAPFVFDDLAAIRDNPTIRRLWPLDAVLAPPHLKGATVGGRPVVNLTLALNYAGGGTNVAGYHVVNLAIHAGAGLLLLGLVRRLLLRPPLRDRFAGAALPLAGAIAALWALHPLQTESVTYVVQRAESLAGVFYLLTLYAFARAADSTAPRRWTALCVGACLLGMATKETMVTAPLVVCLCDRTFFAGTFRAAWRRRRPLYLALAATWIPLAWLVLGTAGRGGTAGFDSPVSAWTYGLTQCGAVVHYLGLAVWPHPLVFDYGIDLVHNPLEAVPSGLALLGLLAATLVALVRWPAAGFAAACFVLLLAPSSSVVPIASQPLAEHRLYLPLAALLALLVLSVYAWLGRRSLPLGCAALLLCGTLTWHRNETYRSEIALWSDTVRHRPTNARAHNNLGNALLAADRPAEAIPHYEAALSLSPRYADALNNLGRALVKSGRPAAAIPRYEAALRSEPGSLDVLTNLGSALAATGRPGEAVAVYERALRLDPHAAGPRYNLANVRFQTGDFAAAIAAYAEVLRLQPDHNDARFNLAAAFLRLNRLPEAVAAYEEILRRAPADAGAHAELANLLAHLGRTAEAVAHFETALRLQPDFPAVQAQLARLRSPTGPAKP